MANMTWRRATDEPLEQRLGLQVSRETVARIRRQAATKGVSAAEWVRGAIQAALEEAERESED